MIYCPRCKKPIKYKYVENRWVRWINMDCKNCGYKHIMKEEEIDTLQPSSELFDLVYGTNPYDEYEIKAKQRDAENEKRKEMLNDKYNQMFKNKEERQFVKDKVLEGK